MSLKRKITATEYRGVPDHARSLYRQRNGGYELDLEPDAVEDKAELDALRSELKEIKKPIAWCKENLGPDPEKWTENYRAVVDRAENTSLMNEAEFEAAKAALDAKLAEDVARVESESEAALAPIYKKMREEKTNHLILEAMRVGRVRPECYHLLKPSVEAIIDVKCDDPFNSPLVVSVVDDQRQVRIHATGQAVSIGDQLETWRLTDEERSQCFYDPVAYNVAQAARNGKAH